MTREAVERDEQIAAVKRMQRYIEEHLSEPITLKALAKEACWSPWYASRVFKNLLGKSPFEYIRSLRLTHAAQMLRQSNKTILDLDRFRVEVIQARPTVFEQLPAAQRAPVELSPPEGVSSWCCSRRGRPKEEAREDVEKCGSQQINST